MTDEEDNEFYNRVKNSLDNINKIQKILSLENEEESKRYVEDFKIRGGW